MPSHAPALKALLEKPHVTGEFRESLEAILARCKTGPAASEKSFEWIEAPQVVDSPRFRAKIFSDGSVVEEATLPNVPAVEKAKVQGILLGKEIAAAPDRTVLHVGKDGVVRLDGEVQLLSELAAKLKGSIEHAPDHAVVIYSDKGTDYKALVQILDACREANVRNVALSASPEATEARAGEPAAQVAAIEKPEIEVEWKGKWWPATVLKKDGERTQIHYIGYGSDWNEWVMQERIRPLTANASPTNSSSRGMVYVTGAVRSAGAQEIPADDPLTVSKAILRAGGFAPYADKRKVQLVKAGKDGVTSEPILVNCVEILDIGHWEQDLKIGPGDLVTVSVDPDAARVAQLVEKNRQAAKLRANEDRQSYSAEQLQEIETLYQVANTKGKRSPEAKESLRQLLDKYDKANRTGCATLYLGQASEGAERLEYLPRAVEKFSDCYYFNGCQVGGYGRYVLALTLWDKGEKDKARALLAELKTTYKDATDHRGKPMGEIAEAVEKELAAKE